MTSRLLRFARLDRRPLASNPRHVFAARHALVHYPSGAIYSFIPKNGCSTLRFSLALANGCIAGPEDVNWIHSNNHTFASELRDLVTASYSFVVLRCPHARLSSVFLDKLVGRTYDLWQLHDAMNRNFDPDALSFRQFVGMVGRPAVLALNIHWRPQSDFLVYEDYDDWFRLEDFGVAVSRLQDRCGFTVQDARALTQHGTDRYRLRVSGCFADTPAAELARMKRDGEAPSHSAMYDAGLAKTVAGIYSADLSLVAEKTGTGGLLFPE